MAEEDCWELRVDWNKAEGTWHTDSYSCSLAAAASASMYTMWSCQPEGHAVILHRGRPNRRESSAARLLPAVSASTARYTCTVWQHLSLLGHTHALAHGTVVYVLL